MTKLSVEEQTAILYWPEIARIPIIPADTRNKRIWLNGWSTVDFANYDFRSKLGNGDYDNGIAVRLGKTLANEYFSVALDFDGMDSVLAWFGSWENVIETAKRTRIEWHEDKARLHMFFLTRESIANRKIQIKDSLLEIRCEGQALFVFPSIHKEGKPYTAVGTQQISILSNLFGLKSKINSLCQDYMSDEDQQAYIRWLEDPANYSKLGKGQGRHNGLVTLGTSYYYRYNGDWKNYTDDERKAKLWEWNCKLAVPKREKEFDGIWKWIVEKHRKTRDEQHEELREQERRQQKVKEFDKGYVFSVYEDNVKVALEGNVWTEVHKDPPRWIVADSKMNVIYKAHQYKLDSFDSKTQAQIKVNKFAIADIVIRCRPVSVVKHESPIDFLNIQTNYTIQFKDTTGRMFTLVKKNISQIMDYLKDNGYVMPGYGTENILSAIIAAFREDGKLLVEKSVDFEGYYYAGGDIHRSGEGIENKHPRRIKEECALAADFLEQLSRFYQYNGLDRRDVLATAIKWTIPAPFNFVLKQLTKKYMSGISFSGERDGGKSALSELMLEIHGHFADNTQQSIYDLSAGSANTDAKFGNAVSQTTYPVAISEYGTVEKYSRDEKLVETFKNVIDRLICRHGRKEGKYDYPFLSLSPLILNGNPLISKKGELLKRLHTVKHSQEDRHDKADPKTIAYNELMRTRRHELRILGDWTINYILDNREELLLSKKYDAYQLMDIIIRKFYEFAGVEFPEWLKGWITETTLEELDVDEAAMIRSILFDHIHEKLRMNTHLLAIGKDEGVIEIETRIAKCLDNNLLSFIRKGSTEGGDQIYYIDSSILMLFENRLPDLTLKRLGEKMGFEYYRTMHKWVLKCTRDQLWKFLL